MGSEVDPERDEFVAILAHELRNPLAAIRAATDTLTLTGTKDSRAEQYRALVDRQVTAMTRMLDDLLETSRVALGKMTVAIEDLDFVEIIRSVASEYETRARMAHLAFKVQLPDGPCYIRGDQIRLRQVINNLLSNALKFTPAGGIELRLVTFDSKAILRVIDSGVGFAPELGERLFEPFFQIKTHAARNGGGLGLGLALGARLAELQGGCLRAASDGPGMGARFSLTMPRLAVSGSDTARSETRHHRASGRVLLIEDNADVRRSLAGLLEVLGCDVEIAANGHEALRRARTAMPDIILCDLGLPNGMDGYEVARACKRDSLLSPVRLIAISGYSHPADHERANAAGFEQLIPKPVTVRSLESLFAG
jgi:CheY-like chemotaxis protein/two-component sensor histidine kinase